MPSLKRCLAPSRPLRAYLASLVSLAALAACSEAERSDLGSWQSVRETVGDTIIVRTVSGSVWGEPLTLREDLAIGVLEGREELMFGQIQGLALDSAGGLYVFDGSVPALRHFDANGEFVRTLGGRGSGPGEYRDAVLGLAVRSEGRILLRDARGSRLNVYEADGSPAWHWPVNSGLFTNNAMVRDTADHLYLKILLSPPQPNRPWNIGLLHLDAEGQIVDSIAVPTMADEPTDAGGVYLPGKLWEWSPLRALVVGVNVAYRFDIRPVVGPVVRVERDVPPVDVLPEERAELEARNEWLRTYQGRFMTAEVQSVPTTKPPYRGFLIGGDGRVWVRRHVTAVKVREGTPGTPERPPTTSYGEPWVYDVFEPNGTYLGEVRAPEGTSVWLVHRDTAWGTREGADGELLVVRLQLDRPGR